MPFSPAATKILSSTLYPAPINSLNTNNQVNVTHSYTNSDQGDLKIDWSCELRRTTSTAVTRSSTSATPPPTASC